MQVRSCSRRLGAEARVLGLRRVVCRGPSHCALAHNISVHYRCKWFWPDERLDGCAQKIMACWAGFDRSFLTQSWWSIGTCSVSVGNSSCSFLCVEQETTRHNEPANKTERNDAPSLFCLSQNSEKKTSSAIARQYALRVNPPPEIHEGNARKEESRSPFYS